MNKKDVLEIKRRMKQDTCTFTRMCGCYVDADHNKITKIAETFLNIEDAEYYKYLDIARKTLSGAVGNSLIELQFPDHGEQLGFTGQQFLMGLLESKLKNDELLDTFYDMVMDSYDYVGNYLILIFHDAYDVIMKTSDNNKLDESEEVYEYLLCAICPVNLTKPGLGYREDENRIESRIRDWVVGAPNTGFLFPAFTERSADFDAAMFYTKDTKQPHWELAEELLECKRKMTEAEKKAEFQEILDKVLGTDEVGQQINNDLHKNLKEILNSIDLEERENNEAVLQLSEADLKDALEDADAYEDQVEIIVQEYKKSLPDDTRIDQIIDMKAAAEAERKDYIAELKEKIEIATMELERVGADPDVINQIRMSAYERGKKERIRPSEGKVSADAGENLKGQMEIEDFPEWMPEGRKNV